VRFEKSKKQNCGHAWDTLHLLSFNPYSQKFSPKGCRFNPCCGHSELNAMVLAWGNSSSE